MRKSHSTKFKLIEAKVKKETIEDEKLTVYNIYKILITFCPIAPFFVCDLETRKILHHFLFTF